MNKIMKLITRAIFIEQPQAEDLPDYDFWPPDDRVRRAIFIGKQPQVAAVPSEIELTYGMTGVVSIWDTPTKYSFWPDGYAKPILVPKQDIYFPR